MWFGVENSWLDWQEMEGVTSEGTVYEVDISDSANILHLSTIEDVEKFTKEFGTEGGIDWPRVKREYDGFLVSPYHYGLRDDLPWYRSLDVASACVWSLGEISSFEKTVVS